MIYLQDGKDYVTNSGDTVTVKKTIHEGFLAYQASNGTFYTAHGHTKDSSQDIAREGLSPIESLTTDAALRALCVVVLIFALIAW